MDALREEVRSVTIEIMRLVGKRLSLVRRIGERKLRKGLPVENLEVERRLRKMVSEKCEAYGVSLSFGLRLLNLLIEEGKRIQKEALEKALEEKGGLSSPYAVFARARQIERSGRSLIHLEVGEPDFGPPEKVKEAVADALNRGYAHYTEPAGIPQLREKIAINISQRFKTDVSPDQVMVTVGGRYAVFLCIASTLLPGDEALIFEPIWPAYANCVREVGGRPVTIPTDLENGWEPNMDLLLEKINKSTKIIILNNPNNPTGKILEEPVLKQIVDVAREKNLLVLSDEVYSNFAFKPFKSILEFPECKIVYVSSFSKAFGMTGFRIGYAISDIETVRGMTRLQKLCLTSVPEFIQHAALAALDCPEEAGEYAKTVRKRMSLVCSALRKLPLSYYDPDGGLYVFPKIRDGKMNGEDFAERLLTEEGVCVTPGAAFGESYGYFFRMSVCQPKDFLLEAVKRMEELLG